MKTKTKNYKFNVNSLTEDSEIIKQQTLTIAEHDVETKYQMLAKNIFTVDSTVFCPGYFNRKTNFIIGEKNSLMAVDSQLNVIKQPDNDTSALLSRDSDYLLYPVPCLNMETNEVLEYKLHTGEIQDVSLNYDLGMLIGSFLAGKIGMSGLLTVYPEYDGFFKLFINLKNGLSLNKNILLNSNPEFVISILKGYYDANASTRFYINSNVNIYTFTIILNYLGASYSIRNGKDNTKKVFIQLPRIFKDYLPKKFIKSQEYFYNPNDEEIQLASRNPILSQNRTLVNSINSGRIILIPINAIDFIETNDDSRMYDLTSERHDATNYSLPMTPLLKNSDGDILAASGIFTKEGLEDAKAFSPDHKEYYRDLNDGDIAQWIADDAILGLYNATSHK